MNRPFRVSILGVMGLVAVASVGAMGLREGTALWASMTFGMTLLALLGATLNAVLRPKGDRAGWVGFAIFGWVATAISFNPWSSLPLPPTPAGWASDQLLARLHPEPEYEPDTTRPSTVSHLIYPGLPGHRQIREAMIAWKGDGNHFRQTFHALAILCFALIGAAWAAWLSRRIARPRLVNTQNST